MMEKRYLLIILILLVIFISSCASTIPKQFSKKIKEKDGGGDRLVSTKIYYVDATNGNDNNTGTSEASAWQTISKVNSQNFNPGDSILFKRGGLWREQLLVPSSGYQGNPIIFSSYGSGEKPIISGADDVTGGVGDWVDQGSNVWREDIGSTEAKGVIFNSNNLGTKNYTPSNQYEWYYDDSYLNVYSVGNPTLYYSKIEASQRYGTVDINGQNFIIIDNLIIEAGQLLEGGPELPGGGVWIDKDAGNIIVQNNIIRFHHGGGIRSFGASNVIFDNNTIYDIDSHRSGFTGDGIMARDNVLHNSHPENITITNNNVSSFIDRQGIAVVDGSNILISGNTVSGGLLGIDIEPFHDTQILSNIAIINNTIIKYLHPRNCCHKFTANQGIVVTAWHGGNISNVVVSNNYIDLKNSGGNRRAFSIFFINNVAVENNIAKNIEAGMYIFGGSDITARRNSFINGSFFKGYGVLIQNGSAPVNFSHNLVVGDYWRGLFIKDNGTLVNANNNIFRGNFDRGLAIEDSGEINFRNNIINLLSPVWHITKFSDSIYIGDNNIFYPSDQTSFYYHGANMNFSEWQVNSGQDTNSLILNPLFADSSNNDFHVKSTCGTWNGVRWIKYNVHSPAVDNGDPTFDYSKETRPNGNRINIGRYGNTIEASKSLCPKKKTEPIITES